MKQDINKNYLSKLIKKIVFTIILLLICIGINNVAYGRTITYSEFGSNPRLLCIEKGRYFLDTVNYNYNREIIFRNDAYAYILSELFYDKGVSGIYNRYQKAVWAELGQYTERNELNEMGDAYQQFCNNYINPTIDVSETKKMPNENAYGPIYINYTSEGYGGIVSLSSTDGSLVNEGYVQGKGNKYILKNPTFNNGSYVTINLTTKGKRTAKVEEYVDSNNEIEKINILGEESTVDKNLYEFGDNGTITKYYFTSGTALPDELGGRFSDWKWGFGYGWGYIVFAIYDGEKSIWFCNSHIETTYLPNGEMVQEVSYTIEKSEDYKYIRICYSRLPEPLRSDKCNNRK